ncbi:MAG: hypothetical protein ABMA13_23020 [Chthoniobacteraceae bacterium]
MTITNIHVTAATGFNHPHESYSNFKPSVSLTATCPAYDDPGQAEDAVAALQKLAHELVMAQKAEILAQIEDSYARKTRATEYEAAAREVPRCVAVLKGEDIEDWRQEEAESSLRGYLAWWTKAHNAEPDLYPAPPTLESLGVPETVEQEA